MKNLIGILFLFSLSANAAVEVHGQGENFFAAYADADKIPEKVDASWSNIKKFFVLDGAASPIVYLYPFRSLQQPNELSQLQDRQEKYMGLTSAPPAMAARFWQILKAITFTKDLFDPGATDAGLVIQVNVDASYLKETASTIGYGLYITTHEMVHVALNRLGVEMKYQHCMMAQKDSQNRNFMQLLLSPLINQGWAATTLKEESKFTPGFGEEAGNCQNDLQYVRSTEGQKGVEAYQQAVTEMTDKLIGHAPELK